MKDTDWLQQMAARQQKPNISEERDKELESQVPRDETGNLTSIGSTLHDEGGCRPCLFVNAKIGCQNGTLCDFCHFPHKRKNTPRPCKGKRDRYRKMIVRMETMIDKNPESLPQTMANLPPSIRDDHTRKSKLMSKMQSRAAQVKSLREEFGHSEHQRIEPSKNILSL